MEKTTSRGSLLQSGDRPSVALTESTSPLLLGHIAIEGFRSLWQVGPVSIMPALTVLTGENDGGKSSFLDAIAFLLGSYAGDDRDHSSGPPSIIPAARQAGLHRDDLLLEPVVAGPGDEIIVEGLFYALDDPARQRPVHIRARRSRGGKRIVERRDRRHRRLAGRPQELTVVDLRSYAVEFGLPIPRTAPKDAFVAAVEEWLDGQPEQDFLLDWRPLTRAEEQWLPRFTRFDSAVAQNPKQILQELMQREVRQRLGSERYATTLDGLNEAIEADLAEGPLARMRAKMHDYCADLEAINIHCQVDFSRPPVNVEIEMIQQERHIFVDKAGEGRLRRLTLALHEANLAAMTEAVPTVGELVIYDEPDTHLDHAAQRRLFEILRGQAGLNHVQVVVATHSKSFIDRVPLESLRHFRLDDYGLSRVHVLTGDHHEDELAFLGDIFENLGLNNSALLDDRLILIIEGATEQRALPTLFRVATNQRLLEAGVTLFNTTGVGAVRPVLDFLVRVCRQKVMVLVDTDAQNDPTIKLNAAYLEELGLIDGDNLHYIGSREFEDAFTDQTWLKTLEIGFPLPAGGTGWQLEEIAALRAKEKFSDALIRLISQRLGERVSKPRLGDALARVCDQDDLPATLLDCFRRISKHAQRGL